MTSKGSRNANTFMREMSSKSCGRKTRCCIGGCFCSCCCSTTFVAADIDEISMFSVSREISPECFTTEFTSPLSVESGILFSDSAPLDGCT